MDGRDELRRGVAGMTDLMGALDVLSEKGNEFCARPLSWTATGEAVVIESHELYKLTPSRRDVNEARAWRIPLLDATCTWVVLHRDDLASEWTRKAKRQASTTATKKGRPTAAAGAEHHPGWIGVQDAAAQTGVGRDRIHRAVKAGKIASVTARGARLVRLEEVRGLLTRTAEEVPVDVSAPAAPPDSATVPTSAPAAPAVEEPDDLEVYS